jgi:hypothetical protein
MELVRRVNSTYNQVNANLLILAQEGIIQEQYQGHLRLIKLNRENPKTELLLQALKILNNNKRQVVPPPQQEPKFSNKPTAIRHSSNYNFRSL